MKLPLSTLIRCSRPLLLFLIVMLCAVAPGRGAAQDTPSNARFGLVNAYRSPDEARDSGAGWEIMTLRWDELQPNGPNDWSPNPEMDQWLSTVRAAGREVVAVIVGTPRWATQGEAGTGVPRGLYLPVSDPGNTWAGFVSRAASAYGSKGISRWVIWRDVDIPAGRRDAQWDGSIEEYYQLVKVASVAAKNANPNAVIHLSGVGDYDPNWFSRFIDIALDDPSAPVNNYYFDVATLHVFYSPERIFTLMQNHFYVMEQNGIPLKEVWINETNARPAVDPQVYPEDATFREHSRVSMEQQAAFIIQSYALGFAANRGARIAVYQLADNLEADEDQAFGLVRTDGSPRQAFYTYQLAAEQFNGFVYARRIDTTRPLIDYVRLTFGNKVTHIAWALTRDNATLIIPSRTRQATLLDMYGNRWTVSPEGGVYEVVVGGAECNDPAFGCLIGGAPWMLIEDGIADAVNQEPSAVSTEEGGTLPTPDPGAARTATAQARPIETATPTPEPSATPSATEAPVGTVEPTAASEPSQEGARPANTAQVAEVTQEATVEQDDEAARPDPLNIRPEDVRPRGLPAILPFILIGLGALAIGGGAWYFWSGRQGSFSLTESEAFSPDAGETEYDAEGVEDSAEEWNDEGGAIEDESYEILDEDDLSDEG